MKRVQEFDEALKEEEQFEKVVDAPFISFAAIFVAGIWIILGIISIVRADYLYSTISFAGLSLILIMNNIMDYLCARKVYWRKIK